MLILFGRNKFEQVVRDQIEQLVNHYNSGIEKLRSITDLSKEREYLLEVNSKLRIEKDEVIAQHKRRELEIEHKLGLERQRQEQELALKLREQKVELQEVALKRDQKRFEDQMNFHEKRFTEEVKYLKDILGDILKRLPTQHTEIEVKKDGNN